jgi:hypothetical protein
MRERERGERNGERKEEEGTKWWAERCTAREDAEIGACVR